ncbi:MAG: D-sedoheptulose 7-phosphate isomerase [Actinomycetota bacterium]|nr:D-sedoheptulose 7-phosphate isomerase [Nitrospiraceae bacterium]MDA8157169.1 D-sedoheptulose 7-phosphate isomerase [Actinomycetota bacterium]
MKEKILRIFEESSAVKEKFARENHTLIEDVSKAIAEAFSHGRRVFLFGNGGSANDASHIAGEFVNRFKLERPPLPAIAINTDFGVMTAISNDYDFAEVFAKQIKALAEEGDIAVAITTSGGSANVIKGLEAAKKKKMRTVVLTGAKGAKLAARAEFGLVVPSADTPRVQETHITLGHVICQLVEEILFEAPRKRGQQSQ